MLKRSILLAVALVLVSLTRPAAAQKYPPDVQKAVTLVREHIDKMKFGKGAGEVKPQDAPNVKNTLPDYNLVIVRFRQFPIARIMPEGLRSSNIFAVSKDGKIEYLKDAQTLQKFIRAHQTPAKTEADAKRILAAWLTLTQEFHQDGMFKFEVMTREFEVGGKGETVAGRAMVTQGVTAS
ncbi:MAG: hypothetical protein HYX68_24945 [Planctomycetes bacterium]|nr:hypothetical protein [Planctomycetota bacterium]